MKNLVLLKTGESKILAKPVVADENFFPSRVLDFMTMRAIFDSTRDIKSAAALCCQEKFDQLFTVMMNQESVKKLHCEKKIRLMRQEGVSIEKYEGKCQSRVNSVDSLSCKFKTVTSAIFIALSASHL